LPGNSGQTGWLRSHSMRSVLDDDDLTFHKFQGSQLELKHSSDYS
jgi:hypothetical protein